jgi:hypothetical protein
MKQIKTENVNNVAEKKASISLNFLQDNRFIKMRHIGGDSMRYRLNTECSLMVKYDLATFCSDLLVSSKTITGNFFTCLT